MTKKLKTALSLLAEDKTIEEIAKEIGMSRWGTYMLFSKYVESTDNVAFCKEDFIFKEIDSKDVKQVLKKKLTKLACNDKYSTLGGYVFESRFKSSSNSAVPRVIKNAIEKYGLPVHIDTLVEDLNIKNKRQFVQLLKKLFSEKIVIFKEHIISIKKLKVVNLIEATASFEDNIKDLLESLLAEKQTSDILKAEKLKTVEDIHNYLKIKRRNLNSKYFMRTCDGWELKPKENLTNVKKVIETSREITKEFFCGFHIEILLEELNKRDILVDIKILRKILLDSKYYKHYKASMIMQSRCECTTSNQEVVYSIIDSEPTSIEYLIEKLRKKGRDFSSTKLMSAITYLKAEGKKIQTEILKENDEKFEKKTGIKRMRKKVYYYK